MAIAAEEVGSEREEAGAHEAVADVLDVVVETHTPAGRGCPGRFPIRG
jgi:hypothetical protein